MIDAGEIIRLCRKRAGMTPYELSKASGVSITTITNIEKGEGRPNLSTFEFLLESMGFEIEILPKEERYADD